MADFRSESYQSAVRANQLLQLAVQAVESRDLASARRYCEQALTQDPHQLDALLWQSALSERYEAKARSLERALAITEEDLFE